jgi:hypothetical protein
MRHLIVPIALLLLIGAGPCSNDNSGPGTKPIAGTVVGEGVVRQGVGPECPGTWAIVTEDGHTYWPVKDTAFQQEGLRVRFTARERSDMASFCMAGTIVDVISIEKL